MLVLMQHQSRTARMTWDGPKMAACCSKLLRSGLQLSEQEEEEEALVRAAVRFGANSTAFIVLGWHVHTCAAKRRLEALMH